MPKTETWSLNNVAARDCCCENWLEIVAEVFYL